MKGCQSLIPIGSKFKALTVTGLPEKFGANYKFPCQCDCGARLYVEANELKGKRLRGSCGCVWKKSNGQRFTTMNMKHGMSRSALYGVWSAMIQRCKSPKSKYFKDYGGRGIKVCDRWLSGFEYFFEDMGERPSNKHSIERIDNNGNYEPANCRWATSGEQARNTSRNVMISVGVQKKCVTDWAIECGADPKKTMDRIRIGMSLADAVSKPLRHSSKPMHGGDIRDFSYTKIGSAWGLEDHERLLLHLRKIDELAQQIYNMQGKPVPQLVCK